MHRCLWAQDPPEVWGRVWDCACAGGAACLQALLLGQQCRLCAPLGPPCEPALKFKPPVKNAKISFARSHLTTLGCSVLKESCSKACPWKWAAWAWYVWKLGKRQVACRSLRGSEDCMNPGCGKRQAKWPTRTRTRQLQPTPSLHFNTVEAADACWPHIATLPLHPAR